MNEKYNIDGILRKFLKPGRYTGGEYGQTVKNKEKVKCRFAFAFPDTYEIGMSNLGVRILYGALNANENIWCERVYAPWVDMQEQMKKHGIPLYAHESMDPVREFDILGFTLQYELCYSTVLNMLELSGIPLYAKDRGEEYPIVIGGGPCAYNAEPIADFFDVFSIGEGEEALVEFCALSGSTSPARMPQCFEAISMASDLEMVSETASVVTAGVPAFSLVSVGRSACE